MTTVDSADTRLGAGLKTRHLTMMGLGSAIGAGLFLGTGVGIKAAGPAVLIAYIIAGLIVVFIMQMLGEMSAARPRSGSFSEYAEMAFGHWAGFTVGWLYWFMLTMVMGAEMTGAAAIMGHWFGVAPWIPALVSVIFFAIVNLAAVRGFGEFEFWFAFIKVAVIIAFLIVGVLMILGLLPGHDFVGLRTFGAEGGFAPHGISGIAAGLLAVAFAFGGIEIVTIAAAESENPEKSIKIAVRSVIWRISVFYLGAVFVICSLLPYSSIDGADSAASSPFTMILAMAHIPGVVGLMEGVIVLALLSAFNAQIYASSRFVYSLAQRGDAPRAFAVLDPRRSVPTYSVMLSVFFAFVSVALQWWNPAGLLAFLLNAVGGCLIVVWAIAGASYLKLHPELERNNEITVRMWGYPWLPILALVLLGGLTALMLMDPHARPQITSVAVLCVALVAISFIARRSRTDHAHHTADTTTAAAASTAPRQ